MQTAAKYTKHCDVCNQLIEASTERGLNQGMGVHKRMAHGVIGTGNAYSTRKARVNSTGTPEERQAWYEMVQRAKAKRRKYRSVLTLKEQRLGGDMTLEEKKALTPAEKRIRMNVRKKLWWMKKHNRLPRVNGEQPQRQPSPEPQFEPTQSVQSARPCKLAECPECGARFYIVKGRTE